MIPPLEDGVLPEGVHECTIEEIDRAFGRFQRSDRRIRLVTRLKAYLDDARRSGLILAVLVDGSFVTAKDEPEDIDLLIILKPDIAWDSLRPFEYNAVTKRMVRQAYHFDVLVHPEGTPGYDFALKLFQDVRPDADYTAQKRKGILRVVL
jgi:Family of unknown function (DUF6932)